MFHMHRRRLLFLRIMQTELVSVFKKVLFFPYTSTSTTKTGKLLRFYFFFVNWFAHLYQRFFVSVKNFKTHYYIKFFYSSVLFWEIIWTDWWISLSCGGNFTQEVSFFPSLSNPLFIEMLFFLVTLGISKK